MSERFTFGGSLASITCHAWNKDRSQIALSPNNNEIHIYSRERNDWKLSDVLNQHDLRVMGIDWAKNTNRIVSCAADRNAYVWSQADDGKWKPTLVLLRINRAATCVKWSPAENKFAVGSGARLISVCYFESENDWWVSKHIKKPIRSTVTSLDWHPNNVLLVAGSTDYKVRVFSAYIKDIEDQPTPTPWGNRMPLGNLMAEFKNSLSSGGGWINDVSFSADGNKICWIGHDSCINIADATNGNAVVRCKTQYLPFLSCVWISPVSIVVAGHSCVPLVYTINENSKLVLTAKLDKSQKKESSGISAMRIFQSLDRNLRTENSDTSVDSMHQNAITCIRLYEGEKENGKKISTSGVDGQLVIWDLDTGLNNSMNNLKI
ncbi:PREDICTED: actin-related protein 2/3 complex subunit 1A [Rhagoletis zephyria]|uniref:actin-related protein 2/3 complex subunit 1A n=1 Tax=Rhagoletis zephyria TaxID=28612 RepID=UPI0008115887|nr:PREDICTED: actin-related protein 2/3 complex subunit 1A [Rhagoletis zephyria]